MVDSRQTLTIVKSLIYVLGIYGLHSAYGLHSSESQNQAEINSNPAKIPIKSSQIQPKPSQSQIQPNPANLCSASIPESYGASPGGAGVPGSTRLAGSWPARPSPLPSIPWSSSTGPGSALSAPLYQKHGRGA